MKIDKAIGILKLIGPYRATLRDEDIEAIKLGIEALKFFKDLEDRGALPSDARLPGETIE